MRLRPYFGETYGGMVAITLGAASACALLSALMFLFRPVCEPILRIVLTLFVASVGGHYVYDPSSYWFWAGYAGFLGIFVLIITAIFIIRKPAQDRRIGDALRRQTMEISHGAPLEPK
jgi:hypothetical protein